MGDVWRDFQILLHKIAHMTKKKKAQEKKHKGNFIERASNIYTTT
jgi:hypothetical protein